MNKPFGIFAVILSCAISAAALSGCKIAEPINSDIQSIDAVSTDADDIKISEPQRNEKVTAEKDNYDTDKFDNVTRLDIRGNNTADLSFLSDMKDLKQLYVDYSQIENNSDILRDLHSLEELTVSISDEEIQKAQEISGIWGEMFQKVTDIYKFNPKLKVNIDNEYYFKLMEKFMNQGAQYFSGYNYMLHEINKAGYLIPEGYYFGSFDEIPDELRELGPHDIEMPTEPITKEAAKRFFETGAQTFMKKKDYPYHYYYCIRAVVEYDEENDTYYNYTVVLWSLSDFRGDCQTVPKYSRSNTNNIATTVNGYRVGVCPRSNYLEDTFESVD